MRGTRGVCVKDLTAAVTFSKGEHRKEGEESGKKQTRKVQKRNIRIQKRKRKCGFADLLTQPRHSR